ncbi:non-heme iron oxygenase ferredoxin subunit [Acuticoccus sp. M5D2P5]|uniref:non-heme iron oxygenase ferredoxin subunit n=1 Tax=Acuticoccus kalidii TaxID=2910977 RepID=UPI001F202A40|nr:non-heme iron oxygenase ferredoxin subunit [Acuticoccus kalidii]MCF3933400.1 non-heme iron oxygenase ferredoxin subunit [Acuticoccus kalidii]
MSAEINWTVAADESEVMSLDDGIALPVTVGGLPIALCPFEGQIYAVYDVCSHGQAALSDGFLNGCILECPLHQGLFDIRDGSPQGEPAETPVPTYPVKVEDGKVLVGIAA